jgi:transcriptional regulator with XRE-family HTH domain
MDDNSIKGNISALREESDISQTEMAIRLGIDRNTYRKIERGETRILNGRVADIARELGVSTEKLVLGYDPAGPGPDSRLEDCREAFRQREQALVENYEHKIEELRREIRGLRELSDTLKEQIKDKNAIISFLRGQKSDNG